MKNYTNWHEQAPPKNTWVWATYDKENAEDNAHWQLLQTCKRGCCVHSSIGSMVLPEFWYLATTAEGLKEEETWKNKPDINMFDLYEE